MITVRSTYLDYLPAIYRQEPFLDGLLRAFERVLAGRGDVLKPGIEEILEGIPPASEEDPGRAGSHRYFDPGPGLPDALRAPAEFLEWLSGWVALSLREDWTEEEQRRILARIVPSYQLRGTREGLREVLAAYTGLQLWSEAGLPLRTVEILELGTPMQLGVSSTVGQDTVLGYGTPHHFLVRMRIPVTGPGDKARRERAARAIIDQEKPAHTTYNLEIDVRTMQLGVEGRSEVGVSTVLGTVTGGEPGVTE